MTSEDCQQQVQRLAQRIANRFQHSTFQCRPIVKPNSTICFPCRKDRTRSPELSSGSRPPDPFTAFEAITPGTENSAVEKIRRTKYTSVDKGSGKKGSEQSKELPRLLAHSPWLRNIHDVAKARGIIRGF